MPEGVEVTVEDGVATVVFVDGAGLGEGVDSLLTAAGDPGLVGKVTLPEEAFIVPSLVAVAAGFLDASPAPVKKAAPKSGASKADVPEA